jgi:hypothetical protein
VEKEAAASLCELAGQRPEADIEPDQVKELVDILMVCFYPSV